MKTNGTLNIFKSIIISFFFLISGVAAIAQQPKFRFANPTLVSGTALNVGATYRFPNVRTNVDALVKIDAIVGGVTLTNIDRTADGFQEAFQPEYNIPASTNGYIEFTVSFVKKGTNTVQNQGWVELSGLDIDGYTYQGRKLFEYNRIDMGGGTVDFDMMSGEIMVSNQGTAFTATNITGTLFGQSVDTLATRIMFTVKQNATSSFKYRVGSNNQMTYAMPRYASLYFLPFTFNNSFLASKTVNEFKGVKKTNSVELIWSLIAQNDIKTVVIEKATTPNSFKSIGETNNNQIHFTDNNFTTTSYYRLKMVTTSGAVQYSSIVVIRGGTASDNSFKVYPSVINSTATVSVNAVRGQQATLQLVDLNGRTISQQNLNLQQGSNNLSISKPANITSGTYLAVIKVDDSIQSQKIMIH